MILTLMADEIGIPTIPENDVPGSVTQMIVHYLTGQIAAYMGFYEFLEDRLLVGVPDYVPSEIVSGDTTFTFTKFGELSSGILNVSKVKTEKVTLNRLSTIKGKFVMHIATGEAVPAPKWEEAGWETPVPQLTGLGIILDSPIDEFAQKVLGQHYNISYGDNSKLLVEFCKLMEIEVL